LAEPETPPILCPVPSTPDEAFGPAVKNFETASSVEAPPATAESQPAPLPAAESTLPASEAPQMVEGKGEERVEQIQVRQTAPYEAPIAAELAPPTPYEPPQFVEVSRVPQEQTIEMPVPPAPAASATSEEPVSTISAEEPVTGNEVPAEPASITGTAAAQELASNAAPGEANKESDIAASTAAAWASWRRIRESGDGNEAQPSQGKGHAAISGDEAAMAAAAGAEKPPEEGPEIASIVDSVLADLRPRIVEEISKKLKKKK
jgi:hypothetical protein